MKSFEKETILGESSALKGSLSFTSAMLIKGRYEGEITATGHLEVAESASIRADVRAKSLLLEGSLTGDVTLSEGIEITESGRLNGDIKVSSIKLAQGAKFVGRVNMLKNPESIDIFSTSPEQLKRLTMGEET